MAGRLAGLGHRGVAAATFHAAALRQLRHFWPRVHGTEAPEILASKAPILAPLAAGLPGGYRYLAVRDLAAEIEWAKARRIGAASYEASAVGIGRDAPLPPDLMARLYSRYESAKRRAGRIDFEDMLELTIGLIETDTHGRRRGARPVPLVLGRRVPGHEPAPAGAPRRLARRSRRPRRGRRRGPDDLHVHRGVERLPRALRRTLPAGSIRDARAELPLDARGARSLPTGSWRRGGRPSMSVRRDVRPDHRNGSSRAAPSGPASGDPLVHRSREPSCGDRRRRPESGARRAWRMARWRSSSGRTPSSRDSRRRSGAPGIPFHVRGERFFGRPEVRRAMRVAGALAAREARAREAGGPRRARPRRCPPTPTRRRPTRRRSSTGWRPLSSASSASGATRSRTAKLRPSVTRRSSRCWSWPPRSSATDPAADVASFVAEVDRRAAIEAGGAAAGVELLTLSSGEGPRMGRRVPAGARGGDAADPAGDGTRRTRRGKTPALRRDHPGAALPVAVVGDVARGADGS